MQLNLKEISRIHGDNSKRKLVSVFLIAFGLLFALAWLSEIVPALLKGATPTGIKDIGAPVNPVHVLDLAFILPGMIVTALSVWRRRPLGLLFAAPLLTFSAVMGIAVLSMFAVERARGGAIQAVPILVMSIVVLLSVYGSYSYLRRT
jgi:hypothetical protein